VRLGALIRRPVVYAALVGVLLVAGTLIGGALYESVNPGYSRIVWLERDGASTAGATAVRRALFADGRFFALTDDGYRAGVLDHVTTDAIFTALRAGVPGWRDSYDAAGVTGERIELLLDGTIPKRVEIANPGMNFGLPADLERVLRSLASADRTVATTSFTASSLVFSATAADGSGAAIDSMPVGFPLAEAGAPSGVKIGGADLAIVRSMWTDLDSRMDPALAHRLVSVDGKTWQIAWRLDVDAIGPLQLAVRP
jgi:hypothetical protein